MRLDKQLHQYCPFNAATMPTHLKTRAFREACEIIPTMIQQMRFDIRPRSACLQPVRFELSHSYSSFLKPFNTRFHCHVTAREKAMFMTFDPERYRADLAPLNLPKDKEDELLTDLWKVIEVLFDHLDDPDFYPLHLSVAQNVVDSLEEAIELALEEKPQTDDDITDSKETAIIFNQATDKEDV